MSVVDLFVCGVVDCLKRFLVGMVKWINRDNGMIWISVV